MYRPRILKALLPKRTASVNQLFSSFKNHLQVADVRFKSAFMYPMMHRFILWVRFLRKIQPPLSPSSKNHTHFGCTHLYGLYMRVPPPPGKWSAIEKFYIMDWARNKRQLGRNSKWKINAIVTDLHKQKLMYFGHLKRRGGLEKIILEGKDRWEKRKRKTEEPVGNERHVRDVFNMSLTEVGRLHLLEIVSAVRLKMWRPMGKATMSSQSSSSTLVVVVRTDVDITI